MRKFIVDFLRRGSVACGFGPVVLAAVYLILQQQGVVQTLTVNEVCMGIVSLLALAFVAGGMNAVYQIEQLPLMGAILIHGIVLYLCYLATYLLNDWLQWGMIPVLVFTGIFVFGYLVIWAIIYSIVCRRTVKLNKLLKEKQAIEKGTA